MQMIKDDMVHAVSRYMNVDDERIEIQMKKIKQPDFDIYMPVLYANIPIRELPDKGIY